MLRLPSRWRSVEQARNAVANQLRARFFLRLHAFALFAWTLGIGYAASKIAFAIGVPTFTERYMLSGTVGYLAFLLGIRIWLWHIEWSSEQFPHSLDDGDVLEMSAKHSAKNTGDVISAIGDGVGSISGDGCFPIVLIAAVAIIVVLLVAMFGPELLIEVAFEAVLAGSLISAIRLGREPDWLAAAFRKTIWIFAVVMLAMAAFGHFAQKNYPQATTARQVIHQMMQ